MDLQDEIAQQVPLLQDDDLWANDVALQESLRSRLVNPHAYGVDAYGSLLGSATMRHLANQANRHTPQWQAYNHQGQRTDSIEFHSAWQQVLHVGMEQGLHCSSRSTEAHIARAAAFYMHGQIEAGSLCPMTMTRAAAPIIRAESELAAYTDLLDGLGLDDRDIPLEEKNSLLIGMGLTEMQGGSDLSGISTRAIQRDSATWELYGHKWFFSVPQADAHLVLAREDQGLSCFWVPRWWSGSRNPVQILRLKDKLGNRSNASAEVQFHGAKGRRVGQAGQGLKLLIGMAGRTRVDCVLGSAALMRQAVVQAIYFSSQRHTFGQALVQHELMQAVLADMALESEAAMHLGLALSSLANDEQAPSQALLRVMAPAAKFWVCKRAIQVCAEAMEVWGGNGYIETSVLPYLYREAPVNSIWEGSGNIMCLDVLRALSSTERRQAVRDYIEAGMGLHPSYEVFAQAVLTRLHAEPLQSEARSLARDLVFLYQARLLLKEAPAYVADAFINSRCRHFDGSVFGLRNSDYAPDLIQRAWIR